jgi:hypothetical protein
MVRKAILPSSVITALLLMYLKRKNSVLELVRFFKSNPDWLVTLNLKSKFEGKLCPQGSKQGHLLQIQGEARS